MHADLKLSRNILAFPRAAGIGGTAGVEGAGVGVDGTTWVDGIAGVLCLTWSWSDGVHVVRFSVPVFDFIPPRVFDAAGVGEEFCPWWIW